ncbi:MAG: PKD domain-containing protein [Bacteroidia bacterium]|nr:PKD domain-containing protein [Bacteroidia bacterium]
MLVRTNGTDPISGGTFTIDNIAIPDRIFSPGILAPGPHTLEYIYESGGCEASVSRVIQIDEGPNVNDFTVENPCVDQLVTFRATIPAAQNAEANAWTFTWFFGDGEIIEGLGIREVTKTYVASRTYNVSLTITRPDNSCALTIEKAVNIFPTPSADFTFTGQCEGSATSFQAVDNGSIGITSWSWSFGGSGSTISHPFPGPGSYPVTLTVSSNEGCSSSITKLVNIFPVGYPYPGCTLSGIF